MKRNHARLLILFPIYTAVMTAVLLVISGCTFTSSTPEPVETVTTYRPTSDELDAAAALGYAWGELGTQEQKIICLTFKSEPDRAWAMFSEGGGTAVTKADFVRFFSGVC